MENPQSFTARRSAASNLPNFQLPPPDFAGAHKYPTYPSASQPPVSTVLTPPSNNDSLSPLSSGVNSSSSMSSNQGVQPYNPTVYWPGPGQPQYSFNSAPPMPAPLNNNMYNIGRQLYTPGMGYPGQRDQNSPATNGGNLPPPPYELALPPFPTPSNSGGGGGQGGGGLPTLAPQQQSQHQQQQGQQQMMNPQPPSASQTPQQAHASEHYGGPRPPPTPTYNYAPTSTPQQSSFPAYAQPSPTHQQQSPISSGPPQSRISPVSASHPQSMQPPITPHHGYPRPPYTPQQSGSGYALPAMSGPILTNMHQPGAQMQIMGGAVGMSPYGQGGHMGSHMYMGHPGQAQQQNDRPFKCDQCPQSFNRNHDLKRHKRIHLAVKPFPCGHCEKSFSRKDALKVSISTHISIVIHSPRRGDIQEK